MGPEKPAAAGRAAVKTLATWDAHARLRKTSSSQKECGLPFKSGCPSRKPLKGRDELL